MSRLLVQQLKSSYYVAGNYIFLVFFFQAEDGIRDSSVTGVQTCALPILRAAGRLSRGAASSAHGDEQRWGDGAVGGRSVGRGEVGGHWRGRTPQAQGRGTDRDDPAHVLCAHGACRDVCRSG